MVVTQHAVVIMNAAVVKNVKVTPILSALKGSARVSDGLKKKEVSSRCAGATKVILPFSPKATTAAFFLQKRQEVRNAGQRRHRAVGVAVARRIAVRFAD